MWKLLLGATMLFIGISIILFDISVEHADNDMLSRCIADYGLAVMMFMMGLVSFAVAMLDLSRGAHKKKERERIEDNSLSLGDHNAL